jgi:tetratricopeptide (TPR) repeat protein
MAAGAEWQRRAPGVTAGALAYADLMEAHQPGDTVAGRALLERVRESDATLVGSFASSVASSRGEIELGLTLLDTLEARGADFQWIPPLRSLMLAGTGRPDSAGDWLARVSADQSRILLGAMAATAPFVPVDRPRLEALRDSLLALDMNASAAQELSRSYMAALLELRLGRVESALATADSLLSVADTLDAALAESVALWARSIRATAALENEDPAVALEALGEVDGAIPVGLASSLLFDRTRERYLLGTLLVEADRPDEAVRWLEHGIRGATPALLYLPMSQLHLGDAHDRAGRSEEALRAYSRFLRYFAHAEPSMQPFVRRARSALERLTAEGGGSRSGG